jgi:hypothetical protein
MSTIPSSTDTAHPDLDRFGPWHLDRTCAACGKVATRVVGAPGDERCETCWLREPPRPKGPPQAETLFEGPPADKQAKKRRREALLAEYEREQGRGG